MGLYYPTTQTRVLIGSKSGTTRTPATLTASYGAANTTKELETSGFSKLNLYVSYTTGASETDNSIEIRVEASPDRTNWYQLVNESVSAGTSTLEAREFTYGGTGTTASTEYNFTIGLDIFYKYMRISAKESGVAANFGTVYIEGAIAGK